MCLLYGIEFGVGYARGGDKGRLERQEMGGEDRRGEGTVG